MELSSVLLRVLSQASPTELQGLVSLVDTRLGVVDDLALAPRGEIAGINGNPVANRASQELVHRQTGEFAEDVPEGNIDAADGVDDGASSAEFSAFNDG